MTHLYKAFYAALLVLGLAGALPLPAHAGSYYDTVCNCMRPESQYTTRHVVRGAPIVRTHERIVNHTNVVKRTHLIQENRLIVHVRPVINREVVVHRQNTIVRNITLHRVNTTNKTREEFHHVVINRYAPGATRVINEYHEVRGVNCYCGSGYGGGYYREGYHGGEAVSYRD